MLIVVAILALAVVALATLVYRARRQAGGADQPGVAFGVLDRAHDAFVAVAPDGSITAWNLAAETMFGWRRDEAIGAELAGLVVPEDVRDGFRHGLAEASRTGTGPLVGPRTEVAAQHRDGIEIPVEVSASAVPRDDGSFGFYAFIRDVTERRLLEAQQRELLATAGDEARLDGLTTLPNRRAWDDELERELARARRLRQPMCVALIDLDHLEAFNDANGNREGDRLLRRAATTWKLAVRTSDYIARYAGEEFAVLLPDCELDEAMVVIERMRRATPQRQTASAGVAQWNRYEAGEALLDRADLALFNAKRDGRNRAEAAA
jgi:diguanylate cyclase (GGDEF)-like protein/PAS domain S-box-containing protein